MRAFATYVATLKGRPTSSALADLDIDADDTYAAALLLRGEDRARAWFTPVRIARATRFAEAAGLRGSP